MTIQPGPPAGGRCGAATIRYAVYFAPHRDCPWRAFGASWLGREALARATVGVAALPRGARVEIDAIAARSDR